MIDSKLSRDQAIALLQKLATDDDFRELFQSKPAKALSTIGIDSQTIFELNACCLERTTLLGKPQFIEALQKMDEEVIARAMAMYPPQAKLRSS